MLAGGTLTGKYGLGGGGRAGADDSPVLAAGKHLAARLVAIAHEWTVPPSHLAFAYAFAHPHLASIVFGASSPEQLRENVAAWQTFTTLTDDQLDTVRFLEVTP